MQELDHRLQMAYEAEVYAMNEVEIWQEAYRQEVNADANTNAQLLRANRILTESLEKAKKDVETAVGDVASAEATGEHRLYLLCATLACDRVMSNTLQSLLSVQSSLFLCVLSL